MTLTHEQIAAMTCGQVNKAIAKRLDQYEEWDSMGSDNMDCPDVFEEYPDYCHDWSHAGRLLDDLINSHKDIVFLIDHWFYADQSTGEMYPAYGVNRVFNLPDDGSEFLRAYHARQEGHTLKESIARCWLEWWEVTHE